MELFKSSIKQGRGHNSNCTASLPSGVDFHLTLCVLTRFCTQRNACSFPKCQFPSGFHVALNVSSSQESSAQVSAAIPPGQGLPQPIRPPFPEGPAQWTHPRPGPWGQTMDEAPSCAARPCRECGPAGSVSGVQRGSRKSGGHATVYTCEQGGAPALGSCGPCRGAGGRTGQWRLGLGMSSQSLFVHLSLSH